MAGISIRALPGLKRRPARRAAMFSSSKKTPAPLGSTTLIAKGTVIRGAVTFTGALFLEGRVEGTLKAEGAEAVLPLSELGSVQGELHAPRVTVNGEVHGDIHASERLELAGNARVEGNIHYKLLEIAADVL